MDDPLLIRRAAMRGGEHILDALKKAKDMVDSGESRMMVGGAMNTTTFMVGEAHSKLHSEMCQVTNARTTTRSTVEHQRLL